MKWTAYLLPVLFAGILLIASVRKVRVYDSFAAGAAGALPLLKNLFPYIAAILVLAELFEASGLSSALCSALAPAFSFLGIPEEIAPLVLVKPFSGSGSLSLVSEILKCTARIRTSLAVQVWYMRQGKRSFICLLFILRPLPAKSRSRPYSSRRQQISLPPSSDAPFAVFCENCELNQNLFCAR